MKFDPSTGKPIPPTEIPRTDWRDKYPKPAEKTPFKLEESPDDSTLNRMIQLRTFDNTDIIQGKPGSIYFDKVNGKVKIFVDKATGWKTLAFEP